WGQDLLFAPDAESWKAAEKYLDEAKAEYDRAEKDGREVVAALATRDRAFAQLPYYARWLANYRGNRPDEEIITLLDQAEKAARKAHELARLTLSPGT